MIPDSEPDVKRNDRTPSILTQAEAAGWEAGLYNFGKAESPTSTYFNPGLCRRPDGLWLLARRSDNVPGSPFGLNSIWAIKLDDTGRKPIQGVKLDWNGADPQQQFEDGRGFYVERLNQVGISACTFRWYGTNQWTGAIQVLGFFDEQWQCKTVHYVPFDTNATRLMNVPKERYQKNWLFWMNGDKLCLIYKSNPWTTAEFDGQWTNRKVYVNEGAMWPYGEIRGGTPPVLIGDRNYTFFHSSMPWRGNYRRYYMGALTFSPDPPFEILEITREPLLIGSQQDVWKQRKPLCIFPCGVDFKDDRFLITAGVNDLKAAWIQISLESLQSRLSQIGDAPAQVVAPETPVSEVEQVVTPPKPTKRSRKRKPAKVKRTPEQQAAINERMEKVRAARGKARAEVAA